MQNPPSGRPPQGPQPPRPTTLPPPVSRPVPAAPPAGYGATPGTPPPGVPPSGAPPQWSQEPTQYGSAPYGSVPPPTYGPPVSTAGPRKSRRSLRFLASTCIFTAWLTLVLSVLGGGISIFMGLAGLATSSAASSSSNYFPAPPAAGGGGIMGGDGTEMPALPGLGNGGSGGGMAMFAPILGRLMAALSLGGGLFTLVSGVVTFLLFLGLGQACVALIDVEEQQYRMNDTLGIILARLNSRQ